MRVLSSLLIGIVVLGFASIVGTTIVHASETDWVVITSLNGPGTITPDGGPYTFSVSVTGGTPPYNYNWMVNGKQVNDGGSGSISVPAGQLENYGDMNITPEVTVSVSDSSPGYAPEHTATWVDSSNNQHTIFKMYYDANYANDKFSGEWTLVKNPYEWPYTMPVISTTPTAEPTTTPTPGPTVTPGPSAAPFAQFSSLSGQVEYRHDNDTKNWMFANMDTTLQVDDHVKTGEDSTAIIFFSEDMSSFMLQPESEIVCSQTPQISKIDLVTGKIWVNFKRMMQGKTLEVDMSQAAAGVKGTVFVAESNNTSSTVFGIIDNVTVTSAATGQTVIIGPGQEVTANGNGVGPVATFNITEEAISWGISPDRINDSLVNNTSINEQAGLQSSVSPSPAPFIGVEGIGAIMMGATLYMMSGRKRN